MTANELKMPEKGFTKLEREWLKELVDAIKTVQAIQGRNIQISNTDEGQVINSV